MVKIYIDAGHGGNDPGASGYGLKEKDLTLKISKKIEDILKGYKDVTVKLSRTSDKTLAMAQRTNEANKWGADYLLSVHINAGGGTGYEDFIYNGSVQKETSKLRDIIHTEITKELNTVVNRGKKKANFHMVRESKMPAMLSENLFIDTKADATLLSSDSYLNKIAEGHANGLIKAFNLKSKGTEKPRPDKPNTVKPPKKQVGTTAVDKPYTQDAKYPKLKNYGKNVKKVQTKLRKLGYAIAVDSSFGPGTDRIIRAFQSKHGLAVDGQAGPITQAKLEQALELPNLKIDGYEGTNTIEAEQDYHGTPVDGYISKPSLMIKKRQALLGVKQDGYAGEITIRAEQRRYGTPVDGIISRPSEMIKERQRRLNKGKL